MSRSKDFVLGLFSGALAGAILALLYAPDKGSNTRDVISYRLSTYMDELSHLIERLSDEKNSISEAKRKGDEVVEDARQRAEDLISEAEELLNTIEDTKQKEASVKGEENNREG